MLCKCKDKKTIKREHVVYIVNFTSEAWRGRAGGCETGILASSHGVEAQVIEWIRDIS